VNEELFPPPDSKPPALTLARRELERCQKVLDELRETTYEEAVSASAELYAFRRAERIVAHLEAEEIKKR